MNEKSTPSSRATKSKAAVVSSSSKTLRKHKQSKASVKLSFKSPLVLKTNVNSCGPDQTKQILERLSHVFSNHLPPEEKRHLKQSTIIGINAVTKAIESDQNSIKLILICKEVTPAVLVEHLPIMACLRRIPCLVISSSSRRLGQCLGVPMATCFAMTEKEISFQKSLHQCIQGLIQYASIPKIPWLEKPLPSFYPPALDEGFPKRGKRIDR